MEKRQSPFQAAIQPGLTIGLVTVAYTFLAYFIDSSLLASAWFGLVAIILFFVLIIYFGKQYRSELGGFMSFGTAFNFSFITMVISGLVGMIGQLILFQLVDPSLVDVLTESTLKSTIDMMESFGQDPDAMDPAILEKIRTDTAANYTVFGQIRNFGIALIIYAIIALILGAILKKRDKSLDY